MILLSSLVVISMWTTWRLQHPWGFRRTAGSITVDAKGTLYEWAAEERDEDGHVTSFDYDQTAADLYGYKVTINGTSAHAPLVLSDPSIFGIGDEIEVRYTAESGGLTTGATTVNQLGFFYFKREHCQYIC